MNKTKKALKKYDLILDELTKIFIERYFFKDSDFYWIGNEKNVLEVADYFFSVRRMIESLKYNVSSKQLLDYQEKELNEKIEKKEMKINMINKFCPKCDTGILGKLTEQEKFKNGLDAVSEYIGCDECKYYERLEEEDEEL